VPDVENYLNATDLGLYTSDHESFRSEHPREQCSTPTRSWRPAPAGIPEVVIDGETGFLLPVRRDRGVRARLDAIVEDPARHRALGERARRGPASCSRRPDRRDYLGFYRQVLGT